VTNTAISGARLYWENKLPYFSVKRFHPGCRSAFPRESTFAAHCWAEQWDTPRSPKTSCDKRRFRAGKALTQRDENAFDTEIRSLFSPVERAPEIAVFVNQVIGVVEDIVPGEAGSFSGKTREISA